MKYQTMFKNLFVLHPTATSPMFFPRRGKKAVAELRWPLLQRREHHDHNRKFQETAQKVQCLTALCPRSSHSPTHILK